MARFRFKLDGLLEQRKHTEQQRQRELASCQQTMLALQADFDGMMVLRRASRAGLRGANPGESDARRIKVRATGRRIDAGLLAAHQRFEQAMRHKSAALSTQLEEAQRGLDQARADLLDAARQRKMIEKLRERAHARWLQAQKQRQRRDEQELAAVRH